ncbi:hypothetical protein BJX64DRAFT_284060 [Aspergillus heterothallicus]
MDSADGILKLPSPSPSPTPTPSAAQSRRSSKERREQEANAKCFLWVGIKAHDNALDANAQFDPSNLKGLPLPSAYIAMLHKPGLQPGERHWYHCIGSDWEENDDRLGGLHTYWHHSVHEDRWATNPFCPRVLPIGSFPASKLQLFEDCFYATPPQNSGHFMIRFLRKLVRAGVLAPWMITTVERALIACERTPIEDPKLEGEDVVEVKEVVLDEYEQQMMFPFEL